MIGRDFLKTSLLAGSALATGAYRVEGAYPVIKHQGQIVTVRVPIQPDQLGFALPHEHFLADFVGADKVSPDRYDPDVAFEYVLPHLKEGQSRWGARRWSSVRLRSRGRTRFCVVGFQKRPLSIC